MYYPEAFDQASLAKIEAFYPSEKRVIVREADAVCFACNAINVDRTIILNNISTDLRRQLESRGFDIIEVELTEFLKAGGAAKCLVMKLSRPHSKRHFQSGVRRTWALVPEPMIPTNGRTVEDHLAKTGTHATKWPHHAQWARPAGISSKDEQRRASKRKEEAGN
ncbi:hypothetical protein [Tunturiibacter gelidiferens]|uniref:hypothetical protein n=1 Tax=Tunturiibacter gelidiferens TaxID=3069689 RepID=UPI003D9BD015